MFFVPCIVIQLCNINQQMHTFQINFCTCCIHHVFIIRKTICTCSFCMVCFPYIYVSSIAGERICSIQYLISFHLLDCLHKCMENIPYKTTCTNGLPDDEHEMYATCRCWTVPAKSNSPAASMYVDIPVFPTCPSFPGYRSAIGYRGGRGFGDV